MLHTLLRFLIKVVLAVFGVIFGIGVLAVALLMMAIGLLTSLITGRKPAPAMAFGRFQQFSTRDMWTGNMGRGASSSRHVDLPEAQVVDVEVREVKSDQRLP